MGDKLYIIMPAYNEGKNMVMTLKDWYPVVQRISSDSRLVVINDGSTDNTLEILKQKAKDLPQLKVVNQPNSGHGTTILHGYHIAVEAGADYVFQTDSDGQTLPSEFQQFWQARQHYDAQFGYRQHRQDGFSRLVVTRVLRLVIFTIFHTWVQDANCPYRLMRVEQFKKILEQVPDHYFLANVLIAVLYKKDGLKYRYIPITFRPRQGGVNSINLPKIIKIGRQAVGDFFNEDKKLDRARRK